MTPDSPQSLPDGFRPTDGFQLPVGFRFGAATANIKASGKPDISLIVTDRPVCGAGVFTKNKIVAAPVVLSRRRTPSNQIRAVITNSGNANACTGETGDRDAEAMCRLVAEKVGCDESCVLVMSTGVIGRPLPMDKITHGIELANVALGTEPANFIAAADAICTTDAYRKIATSKIIIDGESIRLVAMCKGAGMISPNMATMLAVILTDASLTPEDTQTLLVDTAEHSFNCISVDGHTSTNDTMLLLSSGKGKPLAGVARDQFAAELQRLAIGLAKQIVTDGEGATHVLNMRVHGAIDQPSAKKIAKTICESPLVKCAITGGDPNWGRIVSAAGYADGGIVPELTTLKVCGTTIYENGTPLPFDAAALSKRMKSEVDVQLDLQVGRGSGDATYYASDLTTDYVKFNSEYTT